MIPLVPEDVGPIGHEAAATLEAAGDNLEARWKAKLQRYTGDDVRVYDQRLDWAWAAIENILGHYKVFEPDDADRQRAEEHKQRLFGDGLEFLLLPYPEQHAESARLIDLIEEEDMREDLDRLVGEHFIDRVIEAHRQYGEVLGIGTAGQPSPSPISLREPLRQLGAAITDYALQVLAYGNAHPDNIESARNALMPIDQLRSAIARRTAGRDGGDEEVDAGEAVEQSEPFESAADSEPMESEVDAA